MKMKMLNELFMEELADMYDAEKRIVKALPKLIKAASSPELQQALSAHLEESEGHVEKLENVFAAFEEKPKGKKCEGTMGILEEGDSLVSDFEDTPALDAAIISAAQKVEHYEISSYGCLRDWAELLGNEQAAELLEVILDEEKAADEKLTELAVSCNDTALGAEDELEAADEESASPAKGKAAPTRK